MAWDEAQYVVDEVLGGMQSGIPPKNMTEFSIGTPDPTSLRITCSPPEDTIIDGQLLCRVGGVKVVRKTSSPPKGPDDGVMVVNVPRGQKITKIDSGLTTGITYYYGFFPYSDHGVYNISEENIKTMTPKNERICAFDQNFADLNPETTITYPDGFYNTGFDPMHTNESTGPVTAGNWLDFLQNTLKNFPFMVNTQGEAVYALDPNDYTKKIDGTPSDYNNIDFDGGAFAWFNRLYMKEEYSDDGESRRVMFSDSFLDGFFPVGFYDRDGNVMNGLWIPMGHMDSNGKTLVESSVTYKKDRTIYLKNAIEEFSQKAAFFGGPIMNVLRDLEYMLFKTTNIGYAAGTGVRTNSYLTNNVIKNGLVPGWYGTNTKREKNKFFHSQVLGSFNCYIRDPYLIVDDMRSFGGVKMTDRYILDMKDYAPSYILTDLNYESGLGGCYPSHLVKVGDTLGSLPKHENTGSNTTGLCAYLFLTTDGSSGSDKYCMRNGYNSNIGYVDLHTNKDEPCCCAVLLLPSAGYSPEIPQINQ